MPQEYLSLANFVKIWQFFSIGTLNDLHIATRWHYIYLLLKTYFVEQIIFAYLFNAKYFRPPPIKALVKNMTIKSSLFKFSKECCHFLFIFIYFRMVQATSVEPVFDMKAQLALCVLALRHKLTLDSISALHTVIHQQHSYYKPTRGAVLIFLHSVIYSYLFLSFCT